MSFRKFLKDMQEETTSADIATVDTKLDMKKKCTGKEDCECDKCYKETKKVQNELY